MKTWNLGSKFDQQITGQSRECLFETDNPFWLDLGTILDHLGRLPAPSSRGAFAPRPGQEPVPLHLRTIFSIWDLNFELKHGFSVLMSYSELCICLVGRTVTYSGDFNTSGVPGAFFGEFMRASNGEQRSWRMRLINICKVTSWTE